MAPPNSIPPPAWGATPSRPRRSQTPSALWPSQAFGGVTHIRAPPASIDSPSSGLTLDVFDPVRVGRPRGDAPCRDANRSPNSSSLISASCAARQPCRALQAFLPPGAARIPPAPDGTVVVMRNLCLRVDGMRRRAPRRGLGVEFARPRYRPARRGARLTA